MPLTTLITLASLLHPVSQPDAAELRARIEGLLETGRVLYVAAHPDDENTQFLAWAVGERGYRAAYLSLTRGDGGQNLIGDEQSPLLGVIRTWELLAARAIDRAEQRIGGVRDFGYSKSAEETLAVWGEESTLADLVWVIRTFRPHVVVTRFPEEGRSHGHHLASARLARAAFEAAGDPERFPEQLGDHGNGDGSDRIVVEPWSPVRLAHNLPHWQMDDETDTSAWLAVDVGGYSPLLGRSWGEIAAESRSQHRSQGFGWASSRGPRLEYFEVLAGEPASTDLFEGIDTSWSGYSEGDQMERDVRAALAAFDETDPAAAVPALLEVWTGLDHYERPPISRGVVAELVVACLGLVLDARASQPTAVPGGQLDVTLHGLLRTPGTLTVHAIDVAGQRVTGDPVYLPMHEPFELPVSVSLPATTPISAPHWLADEAVGGRYAEAPPELRGQPIGGPPLEAVFKLDVRGHELTIRRPVRYVSTDPVLGERVRTVTVAPSVTVTPVDDVALAVDGSAVVRLEARAFADVDDARVGLELPEGWTTEPPTHTLSLARGGHADLEFRVVTAERSARADLRPVVSFDDAGADNVGAWRLDVIDYPHIPVQAVLRPARIAVQPVELARFEGTVGYVMGPGDRVAASLRSVGLDVRLLEPADVSPASLAELDALLVGIRAFNVHPELHDRLEVLLDWVAAGGTLVVQYQTNNRFNPLDRPIGPADMTIGRGRVTDQTAAVTLLDPAHRVWQAPHVISDDDFAGWVQERGLYFAETWDDAWTPLIAANDAGEDPLQGALLVTDHGDGVVVYTGLSLFRQLPAGVPGAYRLLVNLLSLGGS